MVSRFSNKSGIDFGHFNLVINRVCFFHSSLEFGVFLRRSYFFIIVFDKTIKKTLQKLCLGQLCQHNGHR